MAKKGKPKTKAASKKPAAKKTPTKPKAATTKAAAKKPAAKASGRYAWKGLGMGHLLYHCGARKWSFAKARRVAEALGYKPSAGSTFLYVSMGRKGEPLKKMPTLTAEQKAGIEAKAKDVPDDLTPSGKSRKVARVRGPAKPKPKTKTTSKKAPASEVARQAQADAADEEDLDESDLETVGAGVGDED